MAVTLTVGTNTYITLADADTYFANRLYSTAWTGATDDDCSRALIMATKAIDRCFLKGKRKAEGQTLAFPRCYRYDTRYAAYYNTLTPNLYEDGWYCESDITSTIEDACCEEALELLKQGATGGMRKRLQAEGVTAVTVMGVSETYGRKTIGSPLSSAEAKELVKPYLAGAVFIK